MKKLFLLLVVFALVLINKAEARPIPGIKIEIHYGWPDDKGVCKPEFGICSIIISWRTASNSPDSNSEILEAKGEIVNNMLVLNLPKGINEKGRNARGDYSFSVPKEMTIEPDLAKELGVEKLVIAPGKYEFKGNTLALKIVSPRDPASGQATGKRSNIAIDEPGVHKETKPKSTVKPSYDLKENK